MSSGWKTVRVFISSTFLDMQAERDHLVRFVFPRLRDTLLPRRIHLIDVDLRWGVTGGQDALEVCRGIVDECRPRFLCMLGGRYGWVPPGRSHSITADEVHYGVLDRALTDRGFASFLFRDDAATAAMVEAAPGEFREPDGSDGQKKLAELKRAIATAGLHPFVYSARWDGASRRLIGLQEFGECVYGELLRSMDAEFGAAEREAPDELAEEDAAMEAFAEARTERFVLGSREEVLNELLAHAAGSGGNGYVCLTGAPGGGKSALMAYLSRHPALHDRSSVLLIRHFVGASRGSTDAGRTLRRLCHHLKRGCADITAEVPDDPDALRGAFQVFLQQASARRRVVILIDAVNQFDAASHAAGLRWLPEELPPNASVLLSAIEGPALETLRHGLREPREIELAPLTAADGGAIIEQFRRRYGKAFELDQRADLLAKTDAGTPLYLLAALEELRTLGTREEITRGIADLPPTAQELFAWILERLQRDDGFRDAAGRRVGRELVSRFAALLGTSRYGLSQEELAGLLDPGDPQGNVAALLHLLRPYLMRRGELLDFYHGQFRSAAERACLKDDGPRRAAHAQLAGYFSGCGWSSVRALQELPYHLTLATALQRAAEVLLDVRFMEAKCVAVDAGVVSGAGTKEIVYRGVYALLGDYERWLDADAAMPPSRLREGRDVITAVFRCLAIEAPSISVAPASLFQVLWNRLSDARHPGSRVGAWLTAARALFQRTGRTWLRRTNTIETDLELTKFGRHQAEPAAVCFSPDGQRVLSVDTSGACFVWDSNTGREIVSFETTRGATRAAFSPDGRRILVGNDWSNAGVFDAATGQPLCTINAGSAVFLGDGSRVVTAGGKVWRAFDGTPLADQPGTWQGTKPIRLSGDGSRLFAMRDSGVGHPLPVVVELVPGTRPGLSPLFSPIEQRIWLPLTSVAFSSMGDTCTLSISLFTVVLRRRAREQFLYHNRIGRVSSVAFSPDDSEFVMACENGACLIVASASGLVQAAVHAHAGRVNCAAYAPDGERIVSGSYGGITVWRRPPGAPDAPAANSSRVYLANTSDSAVASARDACTHFVSIARDGTAMVAAGRYSARNTWDVLELADGRLVRRTVSGEWDRPDKYWPCSTLEGSITRGSTPWPHEAFGALVQPSEHPRAATSDGHYAVTIGGTKAHGYRACYVTKMGEAEPVARYLHEAGFWSVCAGTDPRVILLGDGRGEVHLLQIEEPDP